MGLFKVGICYKYDFEIVVLYGLLIYWGWLFNVDYYLFVRVDIFWVFDLKVEFDFVFVFVFCKFVEVVDLILFVVVNFVG